MSLTSSKKIQSGQISMIDGSPDVIIHSWDGRRMGRGRRSAAKRIFTPSYRVDVWFWFEVDSNLHFDRDFVDLRFVSVKLGSSVYSTGDRGRYSNNPLAGRTFHRFVNKRSSLRWLVTPYWVVHKKTGQVVCMSDVKAAILWLVQKFGL